MNTFEFFKSRPFDLQIFAEPTEGEGAPVGGEGNANNEGNAGNAPESFTEAQQRAVDRIVSERVNRALKEAEKKRAEDKKREEAERLKKLTDQEKKDQQLDQALKELADLKHQNHQNQMMDTARAVIRDKGYAFSDALISGLIRDDADATKDCIDDFIAEFDKAVKAEVKKKVNVTAPKASGKPPITTLTKAQIMAVADTKERQKLIRENIHLFR